MVAAPPCFLFSPNRYVGKTDDCAHLPLHVVRILIVSRDFLSGTVIEFFISIFLEQNIIAEMMATVVKRLVGQVKLFMRRGYGTSTGWITKITGLKLIFNV